MKSSFTFPNINPGLIEVLGKVIEPDFMGIASRPNLGFISKLNHKQ